MLHFLDNRPGEKYVWHDDSPASPTTPKMWQTFPGHFLKKYEKYLKKNSAKVLGTPEAKPKHRFDDRYVDNKDMTAITAVDKDAIQVTFEKVVPHKENWNKNKKAKLKVTQPPPTGLSALASFPVSGETWARAHVTKLNEIANYMCFFIIREAEIRGCDICYSKQPEYTLAVCTRILVYWKVAFQRKAFAIRQCWWWKRTRYLFGFCVGIRCNGFQYCGNIYRVSSTVGTKCVATIFQVCSTRSRSRQIHSGRIQSTERRSCRLRIARPIQTNQRTM